MSQLADSHCHVQEDEEHHAQVLDLEAAHLAVMGVAYDDWPRVQKLHALAPRKVIPCFGVHPWFAHKHGMHERQRTADVVEAKSEQELQKLGEQLHAKLPTAWQARLMELLLQHPESIVGEFGVDRAAVIPGTKASVTWQHQMELLQHHVALAAELQRPVSLHCVRAYGHVADFFRALPPEKCPPKVMLHSFGGAPDMVTAFLKLPNKLGDRFYFGFSHVINGTKGREKLLQRIRAVPDDRLLLESDHNLVAEVDPGLRAILEVVSEAKGWGADEALGITYTNFGAFFESSLVLMLAGCDTES